ncbi:MAG: hypothetical protein WBA13_07945 [Microcoleaceae cyanobacterium]
MSSFVSIKLMAIKVKEFKFSPTEEQQQQFFDYTYGLKKFWNYCLEQFEILDEYTYYNKQDKKRYVLSHRLRQRLVALCRG